MSTRLQAFLDRKWVHVVRVLMVFICTGTTTARIGSFLVESLGVERFSVWYFVIFIFGLLPIYNVILLPFAFLFGKYQFFRDKQKRTWRLLTALFSKR
jgi:hypothetical protein